MVRFLLRFLGLAIFAASFIALVADGVRSLAADELMLTSLGATWFALDAGSLERLQQAVAAGDGGAVLDPIVGAVLLWPTFAVGGVLGVLLMLLGRRRSRTAPAG